MCGFCGEIRFDSNLASSEWVSQANRKLEKRGPDSGGVFARGNTALGHRRLKIIDLSEHAAQPMVDSELGLSLVFNGCIYNYKELRKELSADGYRFFSTSDTEVILKAYHKWGYKCVERFNGMFAFVIIERDSGRVITARDRLGIKPLYISLNGKRLRFASNLPALLTGGDVDTSIDPVALHYYMSFHAVVPAPYTILKGIRKQKPASVMIFEPDGKHTEHIYWSYIMEKSEDDLKLGEEEWIELVHASMRKAVERRMVADVPVGVLLSGGVDSSFIVGLLSEAGQKNLNTFSIGFQGTAEEKGDEFEYSDIIAKQFNTEHHKIRVETSELLKTLPDVFLAMSEPMVSHDNVGFFLLSKEVAKHLKVVQSGQGADEIFGGYYWYPPLAGSNNPFDVYKKEFFDRDHNEMQQALNDNYVSDDFSSAFVKAHFKHPGAPDPVDKALRIDSTIMLVDDPVKRVDNQTMAWGLEARVPFLDHEVVELTGRIPSELKTKNGGKYILKETARKVISPKVIDRPKGYFPVPELKYIQGSVLDFVKDALFSTEAEKRGLYKKKYVDHLLEDPRKHITPLNGSKLWQLALLELWLQAHKI